MSWLYIAVPTIAIYTEAIYEVGDLLCCEH